MRPQFFWGLFSACFCPLKELARCELLGSGASSVSAWVTGRRCGMRCSAILPFKEVERRAVLLLVAPEMLTIKSSRSSVIQCCHWEGRLRKHKRHSEPWIKAKTAFQNGYWIEWWAIEDTFLLKAYILNADVLYSSVLIALKKKKKVKIASFSEDSRITACSLVDASNFQERNIARWRKLDVFSPDLLRCIRNVKILPISPSA